MKNAIAIGLAIGMSACASTEPQIKIETREVLVPVAVSCVPKTLPPRPAYRVSEADIANASTPELRYQLVGVYAIERAARLVVVEPVIEGCR